MTTLYRHFDRDGALLYVGIALRWTDRTKDHRGRSHWFGLVASVTLEQFASREDAMEAEKRAIDDEHPLHNRKRNFVAKRVAARPLLPVTLGGVGLKAIGDGRYVYDLPGV